jgi:hypothetical protein
MYVSSSPAPALLILSTVGFNEFFQGFEGIFKKNPLRIQTKERRRAPEAL